MTTVAALLLLGCSWIHGQDWTTIIARKDLVSRGAMFRETTDTYYARLAGGKMVLKTVKSDGMVNGFWLFDNATLDDEYIIEMSITQVEPSGEYFGLFWGYDGEEKSCTFVVSARKEFMAARFTGGEDYEILAKGDLGGAQLRPLKQPNRLRIEKTADQLTFLVNGTQVAQCPSAEPFGSYFGIEVYGNQSVEVDDVLVQVR